MRPQTSPRKGSGTPTKPATVNREVTTFKTVFNKARIMAASGHKTMRVFKRYNTELKALVGEKI